MEDYITRRDAEAAALSSTGAKSIFTPGTPIGGKGIVVNMDGGVGGSWEVQSQPVLEQSDVEPFLPE